MLSRRECQGKERIDQGEEKKVTVSISAPVVLE
jgi:hypothetical protein